MPTISFNGRKYALAPYETVLDCLLRNGVAVPYACRAGMCQACLVKTVDCTATSESSKWIKEALRAKGFTLACQWVPECDAEAELPRIEDFSIATTIQALDVLNSRVLRLRLAPVEPGVSLHCRPGQYLNFVNPEGITRSYSIANDFAADRFLELHVAATEYGSFTRWLFTRAEPGTTLRIRGQPAGDCFYSSRDGTSYPILLAGTGTGLAPLYGIARDALGKGHAGVIHLYHGGRQRSDLYHVQHLQELASQHPNFHYHPCLIEADAGGVARTGTLEQCIESDLDKRAVQQIRAFLCGAPAMVFNLRKRLYLLGLRAPHLHCDPFTERTALQTPGTPAA